MADKTSFQVVCDQCDSGLASVFCHSDGVFLCPSCDREVHSVNKIAQRHVRVAYHSCPMWAYREAKTRGRLRETSGPAPNVTCNLPLDIFDGPQLWHQQSGEHNCHSPVGDPSASGASFEQQQQEGDTINVGVAPFGLLLDPPNSMDPAHEERLLASLTVSSPAAPGYLAESLPISRGPSVSGQVQQHSSDACKVHQPSGSSLSSDALAVQHASIQRQLSVSTSSQQLQQPVGSVSGFGTSSQPRDIAALLETFRLPPEMAATGSGSIDTTSNMCLAQQQPQQQPQPLPVVASPPALQMEGSPLDSNLSSSFSYPHSLAGSTNNLHELRTLPCVAQSAPVGMGMPSLAQPYQPAPGYVLNQQLAGSRTAPINIANSRKDFGGFDPRLMSDPQAMACGRLSQSSESGNCCSLRDSLQPTPTPTEHGHMLSGTLSYSLSPRSSLLANAGSLDESLLAAVGSYPQANGLLSLSSAGGRGDCWGSGSANSSGAAPLQYSKGRPLYETQLITRIERPDGTFKELDPERAAQLYRYRHKRMLRLKALAEGSKKIRYECRKVLADARPRVKGRFAKVHSMDNINEEYGQTSVPLHQQTIAEEPGSECQQLRRVMSCTDMTPALTASIGVGAVSTSGVLRHGSTTTAAASMRLEDMSNTPSSRALPQGESEEESSAPMQMQPLQGHAASVRHGLQALADRPSFWNPTLPPGSGYDVFQNQQVSNLFDAIMQDQFNPQVLL